MKKVLLVLIVMSLWGCGSASKKGDSTSEGSNSDQKEESPSSPSDVAKSSFCKGWGYTRKISISPSNNGICEVTYVKDRQPDVIATAQNQSSYCEEVYDRVKAKLIDSGFKCEESN